MDLEAGDEVISMSVIDHVEVAIEERDEYLRVSGARRRQGEDGEGEPRERRAGAALARALRRAGGQGAAPAHHHRQRLRQAHLGLRVPGHQPRRAGHHQHRDLAPQRPGGRHLPGRRDRPGDAGHRQGPDHPHPGARHPHRQPEHPGRQAVHAPSPTSTSSRPRAWPRPRATPRRTTRTRPRSERSGQMPSAASGRARRRERSRRPASGDQARGPGDEPDPHRHLPGHVRPDPSRPSRRDPPGDHPGRPPDHRRRDQRRQGAAVRRSTSARAWSRPTSTR